MTRSELRNLARKAHTNDVPWQTWWPIVAKRVKALEPHNLRRYHRLASELMQLCLCGTLDGQFAAGDLDAADPWLVDAAEESKPHDTISEARYQGELFDLRPQYR